MTNIAPPLLLGRKTSSNVQKALWCFEELGRSFVREDYGGPFGRNRDPAYLALNPNGVVPTLIDGDVVVWESNTICRYLCNRFGPAPIYPVDAATRARCEMWMDWQLSTLGPVMAPLYIGLIRTPAEQRDAAAIAVLAERAATLFGVADSALAERDFLAGETMTLADMVVGILTYRWRNLDVSRPAMPRLDAWFTRLEERPGFQRHVAIGLI
ncbi:MAG TPA: glutathione S-transferase family protein [Roseiarcus sp.]|jgi:glutathione S-transferase